MSIYDRMHYKVIGVRGCILTVRDEYNKDQEVWLTRKQEANPPGLGQTITFARGAVGVKGWTVVR